MERFNKSNDSNDDGNGSDHPRHQPSQDPASNRNGNATNVALPHIGSLFPGAGNMNAPNQAMNQIYYPNSIHPSSFGNNHQYQYGTVHNTFLPPVSPMPPAGPSRVTLDPTQVPLPADRASDFPSVDQRLHQVARPATVVSGSRRTDPKGKGKQKEKENVAVKVEKKRKRGVSPDQPSKKHRGRSAGAANYIDDELHVLFDLLEEDLPLGAKGWNTVSDKYNTWAADNNRPSRTGKSLETKFKQLTKTTKPTGDAFCPWYIDRAHEIEYLMNDKAGSRDLDDEDIADFDDPIEISDDESPRVKAEGPIARRPLADRLLPNPGPKPRRSQAQEMFHGLASALSPAAQEARAEEFSARSFQTTQIFTLNNRVRDLERRVETLQDQLSHSQRQLAAAERRADRAELELHYQSASHIRSRSRSASLHRGRTNQNRVIQELVYPEGGRSRRVYNLDPASGHYEDDLFEMQGDFDPPGTQRITLEDPRGRSPSPAFYSAASGLNNRLPSPPPPPTDSDDTTQTSAAGSSSQNKQTN